MTFLDLQFSVCGSLSRLLLTCSVVLVLERGHCMHPGPPHFWFSRSASSHDRILFWTTELPMDGFFFTAMTILVLPMIVNRSGSASLIIFLNVLISLK